MSKKIELTDRQKIIMASFKRNPVGVLEERSTGMMLVDSDDLLMTLLPNVDMRSIPGLVSKGLLVENNDCQYELTFDGGQYLGLIQQC